ncbi:hypothetical protein [Amycolatopsis benzoatilytica]|uniref:hypothetical protein n=1 Tax=Amycolatopsis benzoatilytica TaxID=346045 RepID=UPI00035E4750|nr:hypothetical protein [Amycolatopsis benzoatilytica]
MNEITYPLTADFAAAIGRTADTDLRIARNPRQDQDIRDRSAAAHQHWMDVLHTDASLEYPSA